MGERHFFCRCFIKLCSDLVGLNGKWTTQGCLFRSFDHSLPTAHSAVGSIYRILRVSTSEQTSSFSMKKPQRPHKEDGEGAL